MDTTLKQRLIGAVVLIALAVIFLPMLIKGPAPDSGVSDVSTKVPDAPEGQFVEIPLNTVGEVPAGGAVGLKPGEPAAPAASEAIPLGADAAAPASTTLPEATAAGDYAVNFGAYATPADAAQMVAMLKKAQLPGFSESTTINGKPAYRVRIGPYADRAQAEIVRLEAVKVRSDVNAQVVALDAPTAVATPATASTAQAAPSAAVTTQALPPEPPKPAAPKPEPAKPVATTAPKPAETKPVTPPVAAPKPTTTAAPAPSATGYAVQVGAFANAASATALRDKLRASGFSAFIEQVKTDSGTQNRVRVGPVATRAAADQLKSQVAAKAGISGQVRPHP
ncbi:SPOR domain-containing protein [Pseudoxanthomonas helianthi]|uniref:SPOR domain-containing protein n=1 Tax=Pseudoxanthomonas helianthi TaxID=1453541 RepID=A0A940WWV7_9GAMM|nr:SPOR domain-containing protein [Pseudoxanthomonas helianthi]MBP3982865.1 SPOR domain-containing protein [Pseudoxanthomonas helianthi]